MVYPAMPIVIRTPACAVVVSVPPEEAKGKWTLEVEENNVKGLYRDGCGKLLGFSLTGTFSRERMMLELPETNSASSAQMSQLRQ